MASQNPSTPVKVPPSAANYTPATLDADLRSDINSLLIADGHITKIQEHLLHSLHADKSNWPTTVQAHALNLLRSGDVTTFPQLLRRVIEDVRQDTALAPSSKTLNGATGSEVNGKKSTNGTPGATGGDTNGSETASPLLNLAVPKSVVDDALKITRESLEMVCAIDDGA
ncbi:hypothetical protein B0H63DRAFT_266151 [Podospora didyma]|uniref:Uncharacterized protein n=1 Tax=Podospora didyma TaxID=330526 RepID=A0AAE0KF74_9PEZI|nr:hypothetical protein B0H63DRAFT_266151 [Podospora didyma]